MNRGTTKRSTDTSGKYKKKEDTDQKRSSRGRKIDKTNVGSADFSKKNIKRVKPGDKREGAYDRKETGVKSRTRKTSKPLDSERKSFRNESSETNDKNPETRKKFVRRGETKSAPDHTRKYRQRIDRNKIAKSTTGEVEEPGDESIRLNKFLAISGICSRREADKYIDAGLVSVNGQIITELGTKVKKSDDVRYNGERLKSERLVYILLNKPKDYITTLRDPYAKKTVMELVQKACKERVYPVGRLDRNTTGVLLLTNDGDLAKQISHPSSNKLKIYHVSLDKSLTKGDFQKIIDGFNLEDGFINADELSFIDQDDKKEIGIEIHSGRNHIVRRIFEYLGYNVRKLDRVYYAGLTKKGLERGKYRFLTEKEISILKMGSYQ